MGFAGLDLLSGHDRTTTGLCPGLSITMMCGATTRKEVATMGGSENEGRLLARLAALGEVTSRPLFGGLGIYWNETIFGILCRDRLYLKVDEGSKADYVSMGMGPFSPIERQTLRSYYEVPPDVLADPEASLSWAREAIRAAMASAGPTAPR
jgi:DNA transformation protein